MIDIEERKLRRRKYAREYWRKNHKGGGTVTEPNNEFDKYPYKTVPNSWRELVPESARRDKYETSEITSPLVRDLLAGKTCYVNYTVPYASRETPYRTLYSYFHSRGYRLRIHVVDNVNANEYRQLLMWCEPLIRVKAAA